MDINQLIAIVKKKISEKIKVESINIEDKTFLHSKHESHKKGTYHLKITIISEELNSKNKIESTKIIYKILDEEINKYIHSLQILIN
tara:strand:- start:161 stop:421 length:261 start_codon:yes stop_codon:yes gene_type:complete